MANPDFDALDADQLLAWWIYHELDERDPTMSTPEFHHTVILEFKAYDLEVVREKLKQAYTEPDWVKKTKERKGV